VKTRPGTIDRGEPMFVLKMPKADENMTEATVVRWLVDEGAKVEQGQDIVACVADKGEFMLYSEAAGHLLRVFAAENSVVPIGYALAAVGAPGEPLPDVDEENGRLLAEARQKLSVSTGLAAKRSDRIRATPAARRVARDLGVDLADVARASAGGLVREEDVRAYAARQGQ
jgi:pyruvate/2-oxoglutarate dehydrogenase complex dihydrolipoamide acyltransferase (E2) component